MLRPIPVALASCTRFFEAMTAMRESFAKLQTLRVGHSSQRAMGESDCVTPPPWRDESSFDDLAVGSLRRPSSEQQEGDDVSSEASDLNYLDGTSNRRLSWPPPAKNSSWLRYDDCIILLTICMFFTCCCVIFLYIGELYVPSNRHFLFFFFILYVYVLRQIILQVLF